MGGKQQKHVQDEIEELVVGAIFLYVLLDAITQSLHPHYSPIPNAESDLAVGPFGYIMAVNFLNRGILSLVFLYALSKTLLFPGSPEALWCLSMNLWRAVLKRDVFFLAPLLWSLSMKTIASLGD